MQDFADYINQMIKDGYWSPKDLTPIKCVHCHSKNLRNTNYSYEGSYCVEYERYCEDCGKLAGIWSYGSWQI